MAGYRMVGITTGGGNLRAVKQVKIFSETS
jgi:hypothetical protein